MTVAVPLWKWVWVTKFSTPNMPEPISNLVAKNTSHNWCSCGNDKKVKSRICPNNNIVAAKTGIDTQDVRPLSQPWMYLILLGLTLLLLLVDIWTIQAALVMGHG